MYNKGNVRFFLTIAEIDFVVVVPYTYTYIYVTNCNTTLFFVSGSKMEYLITIQSFAIKFNKIKTESFVNNNFYKLRL